jgi:hypothetical protein
MYRNEFFTSKFITQLCFRCPEVVQKYCGLIVLWCENKIVIDVTAVNTMKIWKVCVDFGLLQKALKLVHLVEEKLQSSVSLWPLLPRQLLRNRELQLVDGMISLSAF